MRQIAPAIAIALLCLGGASASSWAQGTPPSVLPSTPPAATPPAPTLDSAIPPTPVAPSDEARAAAKALTDVLGIDRQAQGMVQAMRAEIIQVVMRSNGKTPEEAIKVVDEVFMPDFTVQEPSLMSALVDVYATSFSVQELKDLKVFYVSPLGQKLISTMPVVNQQALAAGQSWGRALYQDGLKKHAGDLSKRGIRL